jgi:hypothetical protein
MRQELIANIAGQKAILPTYLALFYNVMRNITLGFILTTLGSIVLSVFFYPLSILGSIVFFSMGMTFFWFALRWLSVFSIGESQRQP